MIKKAISIAILFFILPATIQATVVGQKVNFNIDSSYDLSGRKELTATLIKIANQLYFYADENWWEKLEESKKREIDEKIYLLANEFEYKIYPTLTKTFGFEPKPGIDKDERITILIHPMRQDAGGYSNSGDLYSRYEYSRSNEREMIYLNSQHIEKSQAKVFLAHEFVHLITFNQKNLLRGTSEETWLNEARADYTSTFLGYDQDYKGSNLESRVKSFLENPNVSLTNWQNKKENYGTVHLFAQYLVDHYGIKILTDSLQSDKIGIPSLEEALIKNGFNKNFSQIFSDWLITLLVNDCKLGEAFCYLNKNLQNLRISPTIYYLPASDMVLSTYHIIAPWETRWQRLIGGGNQLSLEFEGDKGVEFKVPYLLCDLQNTCSVGFLTLDFQQKGKLSFSPFSDKYSSLTIMPFVKSKISGFDEKKETFSFSWKIETKKKIQTEEELKKELIAKIAQLQEELRKLQSQSTTTLTQPITFSCQKIEKNLYFGIKNDPQVRCLQEFLKSQGSQIYPEGLVTGNFLSLTQQAVIRFQEKYASEILTPLGLKKGTGFVGPATRFKINQLLQK